MPAIGGSWASGTWVDGATEGWATGTWAAQVARSFIIASRLVRLAPRFVMQNVQPSFSLANRAPRFPFDRVEVEE
jgi:hypothetical protein